MQPNLTLSEIARNPSESQRPDLWNQMPLALLPVLGRQGNTIYNPAGRTNGALDGTPSNWVTTHGRVAVEFNAADNGCIAVPHHDDYSTLPPGVTAAPGALSWVWLVYRPAGQDIGWAKYQTHENPFMGEWSVWTWADFAHSMRWQILGHNPTTRIGITTTSAVPADQWVVTAGRYPGGITGNSGADAMEIYFNGVLQGQSRLYNTSFTSHTNRGGIISIGTGLYEGAYAGRRDGHFGGLLVFPRRYLSVTEIRELSNDILLPFRRRAVRPYWVVSETPSVFKPAWAAHNNTVIGAA